MEANKKILVACIIIAVVVIAIVFFLIPFSSTEVYSTPETYYETEPYQDQVSTLMQYNIVNPTDLNEQWNLSLGFYDVGRVTVQNADAEGGNFSVVYKFKNINGVAKQDSDSYFIASGGSHTFQFTYDSSMGEDVSAEYSVSAPYKTVTVTRYRQVQKERTVLETRTVNKTLFERLLG